MYVYMCMIKPGHAQLVTHDGVSARRHVWVSIVATVMSVNIALFDGFDQCYSSGFSYSTNFDAAQEAVICWSVIISYLE